MNDLSNEVQNHISEGKFVKWFARVIVQKRAALE
jgi:hypothetical protein